MKAQRDIARLMHAHGYVQIRQHRHVIWEHTGTKQRIVTAVSPSDWRTVKNVLGYLRRHRRKERV